MKLSATRYHDFSCGHRVVGHESKCALLHGHNYRVRFSVSAGATLDGVGRVIDFSVIKTLLCEWVEENWDHRLLIWAEDPEVQNLRAHAYGEAFKLLADSIVWVPFNPTAENMAAYLLLEIGPRQLQNTGTHLVRVVVEETRKCSVTARIGK